MVVAPRYGDGSLCHCEPSGAFVKKGRHRRFEEARKLKQSGPDFLFPEVDRADSADQDDDDEYTALARKYGALDDEPDADDEKADDA
jgi:hypothetical protein